MESIKPPKPNIIFRNEIKLSEREAQKKFNERRVALRSDIEEFIYTHPRFNGSKEVGVTFAHEGISSLVCILETTDEKLVLKIHLSIERSADEGQFLNAWRQAGVSVPHVIEEGMLGKHSYVLMDYIDAPLLGQKFRNKELTEKELYPEMGATLRKMHEPKSEGYGRLINGKAEFSNFKDWLMSENMQKRFSYVKENGLLGEEHGSLSKACEILLEYVGDNSESSYCHFDFGADNMFATNPITVFDPNPEFNNGYIDLARSIVVRLAHDGAFPEQMVNGYFANKSYNVKVLQAAILVNSYMKFRNWHDNEKLKQIKNIQDYLISTKYLLEK